jgi:hypothetical protein
MKIWVYYDDEGKFFRKISTKMSRKLSEGVSRGLWVRPGGVLIRSAVQMLLKIVAGIWTYCIWRWIPSDTLWLCFACAGNEIIHSENVLKITLYKLCFGCRFEQDYYTKKICPKGPKLCSAKGMDSLHCPRKLNNIVKYVISLS